MQKDQTCTCWCEWAFPLIAEEANWVQPPMPCGEVFHEHHLKYFCQCGYCLEPHTSNLVLFWFAFLCTLKTGLTVSISEKENACKKPKQKPSKNQTNMFMWLESTKQLFIGWSTAEQGSGLSRSTLCTQCTPQPLPLPLGQLCPGGDWAAASEPLPRQCC